MAEGGSEKKKSNTDLTTVFNYQKIACKQFFQKDYPTLTMPTQMKPPSPRLAQFQGPLYDITGADAQQVVALLSSIVNDRHQFKMNKTFYLLIQGNVTEGNVRYEELFRLKASPRKDQPGNGIVFLRPRGMVRFKQSAKKYDELNGELKAFYNEDTASFAKHIKQLFKNNSQISDGKVPSATIEAYMLFLFEIARRLVATEKPSERAMEFDVLPIGSAIAGFLKLLELGQKATGSFEDVFLPKSKFHCFTGKPKERREAIDRINEATMTAKVTKTKCLKDLQELFCSNGRPAKLSSREEDQLAKEFENLMTRLREEPSSQSSSDAETYTGFDYYPEN